MHHSLRTPLRVFFSLITLIGLTAPPAGAIDTYTETSGSQGDGNFTVGPEYTTDKDLTDLGNPKGKYFEFTMKLADSKIFRGDRKSTRLNSSHLGISYAVFCLKKKNNVAMVHS